MKKIKIIGGGGNRKTHCRTLMNTGHLVNINKHSFDVTHDCVICRNARGSKRWKVWFSYNRYAYVCALCNSKFKSSADVVSWLEQNAIYSKPNGKLIDFKVKKCTGDSNTKTLVPLESINHWKSKSERKNFVSAVAEMNSSPSRNKDFIFTPDNPREGHLLARTIIEKEKERVMLGKN